MPQSAFRRAQTTQHRLTTSFQWELLDTLAALVLHKRSSYWHRHSYSYLFVVQGSVLSKPPNYGLWSHHFKSHAAEQCTHRCALSDSHEDLTSSGNELFSPHSGNKSNKYLNGPENICIFQLSINSAILQKVKNTVDAGCGGTDPVKLQCTP